MEAFSKNPAVQRGITVAATGALGLASAWIAFTKIYKPIGKAIGPKLPDSWHPFNDGSTNVIFQDRLRYCEDVLLDHHNGIAIISEDPGRPQWNTVMGTMYDPNPRGSLHLYDYANTKRLRPVSLIGFPPTADFHPLGINFYRESDEGVTRIFVVNHRRGGSTVDIFDLSYERSEATFITSISDGDNNILSPNAIAPTSYTSFYVTNDHRYIPRLNPWLNSMETSRALPLGWLTHVDFSASPPTFRTAAKGIPFANGVVVTPTGREVVVASTTWSSLLVYDRDPETNELSEIKHKIPLHFHVDNVNFDESLDIEDPTVFDDEGRFLRGLVCAGHPSVVTLYAMSRQPRSFRAPSWVVELRRGAGRDRAPCNALSSHEKYEGEFYPKTLYQSNGSEFPSSSTGALDTRRGILLVSGLYGDGLLEVNWPVTLSET